MTEKKSQVVTEPNRNPEIQPDVARARVGENWLKTVDAIGNAAEAAGRSPDSVRLIGVSKYVDAETTGYLLDAGCKDLGENRPQMMWQKAETLGAANQSDGGPQWHMIGHVQTNKLRRILRYAPIIHSVDSERLLKAIDEESARIDSVTRVLLEVNISGDESKTGLSAEQLRELLSIQNLANVRVEGLMAMAGWGTDPKEAGIQFAAVESLRNDLQQETGRPLPELSMGMSGDFAQAIAAGATMVRIGSALFDGVM